MLMKEYSETSRVNGKDFIYSQARLVEKKSQANQSDLGERTWTKSPKFNLSASGKIQEIFLNHCRKNHIKVELECKNYNLYTGYIVGFDQDSIILEEKDKLNLHYKEAILRIEPEEKLDFFFKQN